MSTETTPAPQASAPVEAEAPQAAPDTGNSQAVPEAEAPVKKKRASSARRRAAQRLRLHNVLLSGVFLLLVLVFFIVNLAVPDQETSEAENRKLAQFPALSASALADGSYFSDLTSYVSDQFFARDGWMSMKLKASALLGAKDASGVYLGSDGYLLSAPEEVNSEALANNAADIGSFQTAYPDLSVNLMLIPDAASVLTDKLPKNAPVESQIPLISQLRNSTFAGSAVTVLDAASVLEAHAEEYIYYKTDHHWTSLGAFYTFYALSAELGIDSPVEDYDIYTVTDDFEGTLSSKSGSHSARDSIQVYTPKGDVEYYVDYGDGSDRVCSLYKAECLEVKDKYTVFFGGNHAKVEISTTAGTDRVLLLFKDSYANCFVQFLLPYYDKIIMIDPRYYYDDLSPVLSSEGVTDVLFLYSVDTFVTDTSLADVLESLTAEPAEDSEAADATDAFGTPAAESSAEEGSASAAESSALEDSIPAEEASALEDSAAETSPEASPDSSAEAS